jgi:hypothetical protein
VLEGNGSSTKFYEHLQNINFSNAGHSEIGFRRTVKTFGHIPF